MDIRGLKEEIYEFVVSLKDTGPVLHPNPRLINIEKNLEMEFWGQNDYIDIYFSGRDQIPGNHFNYKEDPIIKMNVEFEDQIYAKITIFMEYEGEKLVPLTRFIEEHELETYVPQYEEEEEENEDSVGQMVAKKAGRSRRQISYFQVSGMGLYDLETLKQFIMKFDEQMTQYHVEV